MNTFAKKLANKMLRKSRIRARIQGDANRPRLSIFISNTHITAQLIDDAKQHTLASSTTVNAKVTGTMTEKAAWIGSEIAKKAKKVGVSKIAFDRNGRQFKGRLKALADAARKEGLEF
jgi:large subunit ribosomal protein L18